jgi:hypothetical protein
MSAPLAYWNDSRVTDPTNIVTLRVDMEVPQATGMFVPGTDFVYLRGDFNGWTGPGILLTNVPSTTLYAGTLELPYFPTGGCKPLTYKFLINENYETINNRQTNVMSLNPVLTSRWNNIDFCDVTDTTNHVTFSVNMAGAVGTDATVYDGSQTVYLNGNFAGWWAWGNTNGVATNYVMNKSGDIYNITVPMPPGTDVRMEYKYSMEGNDNEAGFGQNHIRFIRTPPGETNYSLAQDTWTGTNPPQHEVRFGNLVIVPGAPARCRSNGLGSSASNCNRPPACRLQTGWTSTTPAG